MVLLRSPFGDDALEARIVSSPGFRTHRRRLREKTAARARGDGIGGRHLPGAAIERLRAAGVEAAARRRIRRRGYFAVHPRRDSPAFRIGGGNRGEQALGVGVLRALEDPLGRTFLPSRSRGLTSPRADAIPYDSYQRCRLRSIRRTHARAAVPNERSVNVDGSGIASVVKLDPQAWLRPCPSKLDARVPAPVEVSTENI